MATLACACTPGESQTTAMGKVECLPPEVVAPLPDALSEASGIARDPRREDFFWLHNDSGHDPVLYGVDAQGHLLARWPVGGVVNEDPEDVATGTCGAGWCLYLGDIGDNNAVRAFVEVSRLTLPSLPAETTAPGAAPIDLPETRPDATFLLRYPDGPRDAESLLVDDAHGDLLLVTKGREGRIDMYAIALARLDSARHAPAVLQRVGTLPLPIGESTSQLVTAADISPDGQRMAVRNYTTIYFFPWSGAAAVDTLVRPPGVSIGGALEPQGEGLAFADEEEIFLASEGRDGRPPQLSRIRCRWP